MKLEKDGKTVELTNKGHISAYLEAGWVEKKPEPKPKAKAAKE
jgi:hypothetical protein